MTWFRDKTHYIEKLTHEELQVVCDNLRIHGAFDRTLWDDRADFEVIAREYYCESETALVTRFTIAIPGFFWKKIKTELSDTAVEELLKGES